MAKALEEVIKDCQNLYDLKVDERTNPIYTGFLRKQLAKHPKYDLDYTVGNGKCTCYPYRELLADILFLYSVIMRETPVVDVRTQHLDFVGSADKLRNLRVAGSSPYLWDDENLYRAYNNRKRNNAQFGKMGLKKYTELINELGSDPSIVKIWGKTLTYESDISCKIRRPRFL
jgi:hypothetical protein